MTGTSDPILAVRHLTTVFPMKTGGTGTAVDDVSFDVRRGETLGLVGESGSGKSVTALSIVGLASPGTVTGGEVIFDGRDLLRLDDDAMDAVRGRQIGFVFQEPMVALDPVYTIGAQITETLGVHGLARGESARRRAVEWLDAVRMSDPHRRLDEYPHQLSGGLRQRAMIALALAAEPSLLIADEPTTALDVTVQAEILDLILDLRRRLNLSILLITHDFGVVAEAADRVAVMYAGQIVEQAATREILADPRHPYTRGLLASVPNGRRGERLHAVAGGVPAIGTRPAGCAFAPRCPSRFTACDAPPAMIHLGDGRDARCFLFGSGTV